MAVVPIISQSWDTTSYVNPTRMNNIETNISTLSKATGIEYSEGVSVKDKIDTKADSSLFDNFKTLYRNIGNTAEEVYIDANYHTYLVTCYGGGTNMQVAIVSFRSNSDYMVQNLVGNGVSSNGYRISFGFTVYHIASVIQLA